MPNSSDAQHARSRPGPRPSTSSPAVRAPSSGTGSATTPSAVHSLSREAELEEITDALLMSRSDDFNALAAAELRGDSSLPTQTGTARAARPAWLPTGPIRVVRTRHAGGTSPSVAQQRKHLRLVRRLVDQRASTGSRSVTAQISRCSWLALWTILHNLAARLRRRRRECRTSPKRQRVSSDRARDELQLRGASILDEAEARHLQVLAAHRSGCKKAALMLCWRSRHPEAAGAWLPLRTSRDYPEFRIIPVIPTRELSGFGCLQARFSLLRAIYGGQFLGIITVLRGSRGGRRVVGIGRAGCRAWRCGRWLVL